MFSYKHMHVLYVAQIINFIQLTCRESLWKVTLRRFTLKRIENKKHLEAIRINYICTDALSKNVIVLLFISQMWHEPIGDKMLN